MTNTTLFTTAAEGDLYCLSLNELFSIYSIHQRVVMLMYFDQQAFPHLFMNFNKYWPRNYCTYFHKSGETSKEMLLTITQMGLRARRKGSQVINVIFFKSQS